MIETWSSGVADDNMSQDILTDLTGLIERHPWWRARVKLALDVLARMNVHPPARVLDVGCGWGVNLAALEARGYRVVGLDISRQALERLDSPGRRLIEADLTQPLPPDTEPYDAVLALDVIEHLDDDRGAAARLAQVTKPGGVIVVSVPALPELFSEFDSVQGHRRRYLPETLRAVFGGTDVHIEALLWWGAWMVPILKRRRNRCYRAQDDSPAKIYRRYLELPPWPAPLLMRAAFMLDGILTMRQVQRTGTSLFALGRRRAVVSPA